MWQKNIHSLPHATVDYKMPKGPINDRCVWLVLCLLSVSQPPLCDHKRCMQDSPGNPPLQGCRFWQHFRVGTKGLCTPAVWGVGRHLKHLIVAGIHPNLLKVCYCFEMTVMTHIKDSMNVTVDVNVIHVSTPTGGTDPPLTQSYHTAVIHLESRNCLLLLFMELDNLSLALDTFIQHNVVPKLSSLRLSSTLGNLVLTSWSSDVKLSGSTTLSLHPLPPSLATPNAEPPLLIFNCMARHPSSYIVNFANDLAEVRWITNNAKSK